MWRTSHSHIIGDSGLRHWKTEHAEQRTSELYTRVVRWFNSAIFYFFVFCRDKIIHYVANIPELFHVCIYVSALLDLSDSVYISSCMFQCHYIIVSFVGMLFEISGRALVKQSPKPSDLATGSLKPV